MNCEANVILCDASDCLAVGDRGKRVAYNLMDSILIELVIFQAVSTASLLAVEPISRKLVLRLVNGTERF